MKDDLSRKIRFMLSESHCSYRVETNLIRRERESGRGMKKQFKQFHRLMTAWMSMMVRVMEGSEWI